MGKKGAETFRQELCNLITIFSSYAQYRYVEIVESVTEAQGKV